MENLILFKTPIALIALILIVALHVLSAISDVKWKNKYIPYLLAIPNLLLHVLLIATSLIKDAGNDELFLAIMISTAVGVVSMGIAERLKGRGEKE